jgi:hypothetical protein
MGCLCSVPACRALPGLSYAQGSRSAPSSKSDFIASRFVCDTKALLLPARIPDDDNTLKKTIKQRCVKQHNPTDGLDISPFVGENCMCSH